MWRAWQRQQPPTIHCTPQRRRLTFQVGVCFDFSQVEIVEFLQSFSFRIWFWFSSSLVSSFIFLIFFSRAAFADHPSNVMMVNNSGLGHAALMAHHAMAQQHSAMSMSSLAEQQHQQQQQQYLFIFAFFPFLIFPSISVQ